ncbi:MAG: FG-GAP-like repeat-containing protein [Planctomycetota bacterium]
MTGRTPLVSRTVTVVLLLASAVGAQQFVQETSTRFPIPNPAEWTNQLTIDDLDNDGDLDIVFANGGDFGSPGTPQLVRIFINNAFGFFTDESVSRTGGLTGLHRGVELGDVENDGDLDIILAQDFNRLPNLLINNGAGFFSIEGATRLPPLASSSSRAQFGDIDNDGDLDIYIDNGGTTNRFGCGQNRIYVNNGSGFFTDETSTRHPLGVVCEPMDMNFADIDNDFDLDVRTASTANNASKLYRNNGAGVFTAVAGVPADEGTYAYDFGDIDNDGDLDMFGANGGPGVVDILLINNGLGAYTNGSSQLLSNPNIDDNDSKFFDYDNDGDLDLIIAALGGTTDRILNNNGTGTFSLTAGVITAQTDSSLDIEVADLTGDGKLDIVTGQGESGNFQNRIYINNGPADSQPPIIIATEQQPDTFDTAGPYVIRALVLDDMTSDRNFFTGGIFLNYTVNAGAPQQVAMRHSGGQVNRGELPGQLFSSTVEYWITAKDFNNNEGTGPTRSFLVQVDCTGVHNCSGNGVCVGTDLCACNPGWSGSDCGTATPVPSVSSWGMMGMGLMMLTAGRMTLRKGRCVRVRGGARREVLGHIA